MPEPLEYRAKAYYQPNGKPDGFSTILYSGATTRTQADIILAWYLELPTVTGGHLERHEQGFGWCLADDEPETVATRKLDDDWIPPHGRG